jgi:membrane fusion protein (multidrug efflux system)
MTECPQITPAVAPQRQLYQLITSLSLFLDRVRMPLQLLIAPLLIAMTVVSQGCGGGGDEGAGGGHAAEAAQHGKGGRGERSRPSQPPIPVAIDKVTRGDIASYYTATATLTAEKEAQILARATGVALSLHCEEGDWVQAGQTLLRIEDHEYRLRLAQAEATTANLKGRYERLKGMWKQQMVSAEEYESTENELKAAEAAEELARLNLSYTTVKAPFTGRVVGRLVDVGQNINTGTPLFVIADFDPLLAIVHVPSKEFKKLKPDQKVTVILDSTKQRLEGRIKLVSPVIDPTSGTIKITVEIPEYPTDTRPGDFAEVNIITEKRAGTTLVPKIAVFTDRGDQIVYVAADSTAERRVVELGFEDDENAEITSGVSEGEDIIVKGQRSLKHGAPIKILEADTASAGAPNKQAGP